MSYENYPVPQEIKNILVVIFRHLGDVLLTSPIFSNLKNHFPYARIDVYLYKGTEPMIEGNPAISEIITYDRKIKKMWLPKKIFEEIRLLRMIRKRKYDLVLNMTEGDRGAIAAKASNAKYLIGYDNKQGMKGKGNIYTHIVKQSSTPRHRVEKNLDFIRRIGVFPKKEEKSLFFHIPEGVYENMKELLSKNDFSPNNYILIHPASRWRFKCWDNSKVRNLSKLIIEKGERIIFTAGTEDFEKEMIEEIIKDLPKDRAVNLSGKVSLKELGALIDMSKLLICVDSVPFHMASALKKKCVCLFGPTDEKTWGPWENEGAKVISEPFSCRPCLHDGCGGSKKSECLSAISEEKVLAVIDQMT